MENLIFGLIIITAIICCTVYKIDYNHVNKPKNNYPTGGLVRTDYETKSPDRTQRADNYRSLGKPKIPKGERVPPGRCSRKPEKAPIPPRKDSE